MKMWIALLLPLFASALAFGDAKPKYGPDATPLSRRSNLDYFKRNPAPDFWALIGYYIPQASDSGCSAANFALVLNAARTNQPLTASDKLVTFANLLSDYTDEPYRNAMSGKLSKEKFDRQIVSNKNLARVLKEAADKLGISTPATSVEVVNVDLKNLDASRKTFREYLKRNERSADDFMIISFIQGKLTGDPEGGAHVATIGAYDAKKDLVLILDPDREWYEPYWSPAEKVFEAIADPRSDANSPGWLYFKVR